MTNMNEREEALRLVATAVRRCNELTDIAATISVAAKLLAEEIDDIERASTPRCGKRPVRCGISTAPMSARGQTRPSWLGRQVH
jgi:hypothetical protein